jgi:hypothetical protein
LFFENVIFTFAKTTFQFNMKKLFTFISVSLIGGAIWSQTCTPKNLPEPKFEPKPDSINCFVNNQDVDQTFYFRIPDKAGPATIKSIKINSVGNLPTGLTYTLNKANATYNANENGCVKVTGKPTGTAGQYRLGINVTVDIGAGQPLNGDLVELANGVSPGSGNTYLLWVRVKADDNAGCPCIDTNVVKKDSIKVFSGNETTCPNLLNSNISDVQSAISQLSIAPNPVANTAVVEFISEKNAVYTAKITNLIGKEVMRKTVDIRTGSNTISFNRNDLPGGVYFFSLSDGKGLITKRFIVE